MRLILAAAIAATVVGLVLAGPAGCVDETYGPDEFDLLIRPYRRCEPDDQCVVVEIKGCEPGFNSFVINAAYFDEVDALAKNYRCINDCNDTGLKDTEAICLGRPTYNPRCDASRGLCIAGPFR